MDAIRARRGASFSGASFPGKHQLDAAIAGPAGVPGVRNERMAAAMPDDRYGKGDRNDI